MSRMKDIATEALLDERGKDWGDPVATHEAIALVWTGLLRRKLIKDIEPHEVATMMSGLKLVRHTINPDNPDSLDDSDAYNEINRRCVQSEQSRKKIVDNWYAENPAMQEYQLPEVTPDEDKELGVATMGENWLEMPLPGFGLRDESSKKEPLWCQQNGCDCGS